MVFAQTASGGLTNRYVVKDNPGVEERAAKIILRELS